LMDAGNLTIFGEPRNTHPWAARSLRQAEQPSDRRRTSTMSDILLRPIVAMQIAVHRLREREDGQTTTEYAILLGFLAIAIIIALFFLRNVLRSLFSSAASSVSNAPGG
jgi:Flp pilus assembly pilin Flp